MFFRVAWRRLWSIVVGGLITLHSGSTRADVTPREVDQAIREGVRYLRSVQELDGSWGRETHDLVLLALLTAGVAADDPAIARGLDWSLRQPDLDRQFNGTYMIALQTMVLATVDPVRFREPIARNAAWLERTQIGPVPDPRYPLTEGGWTYPNDQHAAFPGGDNSNTQYALLGLNAAAEAGVKVSPRVWAAARHHWVTSQRPDGGWSYLPSYGAVTASMTCAGISSLAIIQRWTAREGEILAGDKVKHCARSQAPTDFALDRATDWLGKHFTVDDNPGARDPFSNQHARWVRYYLYSLERAGRLSGTRLYGGHDWYREGSAELVRTQRHQLEGGLWTALGNDSTWETSFALLFLARGRTPLLINKLKHGPAGDWDNDADDIRHLTARVGHDWQRPLTWQVIDPAPPLSVEDLLQAPVTFLNGHLPPTLSRDARRSLRDYADQGGFLFLEACCGRSEFDAGVRSLIRDLFPEAGAELHPLADDHPIWRARFELDPANHPLWGVELGCRTVLIYSPTDLSCSWNLANQHPDHPRVIAASQLGLNVITYATRGQPPADKLRAREVARDRVEPPRRGALRIAKLQHAGDWNPAPLALPNLTLVLRDKLKIDVVIQPKVMAATDPSLVHYPLIYLHGRGPLTLGPGDLAPLRQHLDPGGGTIFADSACGDVGFDASFRRFVATLYPARPLAPIPPDDPLNTPLVGFNLTDVRTNDGQVGPPRLEGIKIHGRWAVIYSPLDIGCALETNQGTRCPGYTPESALRIASNIVLYATLP